MKWLLRKYMSLRHIETFNELNRLWGLKESTFYKRIKEPETLRVTELIALAKVLNMTDEDILQILRGEK